MHFEILVEDASGKIALESILEKILGQEGQDHTYKIISYKGIGRIPKKRMLLNQLPQMLKAYGKSLQDLSAGQTVMKDKPSPFETEFLLYQRKLKTGR